MGYCNIESIFNLPLTAKKVVIIKTPKQTFKFRQLLYKPYIMAKLQRQILHHPLTLQVRTPFKYIHFNIIIMGKGYSKITCITHF